MAYVTAGGKKLEVETERRVDVKRLADICARRISSHYTAEEAAANCAKHFNLSPLDQKRLTLQLQRYVKDSA